MKRYQQRWEPGTQGAAPPVHSDKQDDAHGSQEKKKAARRNKAQKSSHAGPNEPLTMLVQLLVLSGARQDASARSHLSHRV